MKIWYFIIGLILVSAFLLPAKILAAPQTQLNYQARLMDRSGNVVSEGTYSVRFAIYTESTGGDAVWSESHLVSVKSGVFSVMLGSIESLNIDFTSSAYYLGTKIGSDSELSPRKRIGAAPFAVNSSLLDGSKAGTGANDILKLGNSGQIDIAGKIKTTNDMQAGTTAVDALTVSTTSTFSGTVTANGLINANNGFALSSGTLTLPNGAIETSDLADLGITTEKIANQSITSEKLASSLTVSDFHSTNITNVSNIQTDTFTSTGLATLAYFQAYAASRIDAQIASGAALFVSQASSANPTDERAALKVVTAGSSAINDFLIMGVYDDPIAGPTRAFTVDYAGNVYARGNITLESGSTVDGVDISAHKHTGADGSATLVMSKSVYIDNLGSITEPTRVDWFGFPINVTAIKMDVAVEDDVTGNPGEGFIFILTDQDQPDPGGGNDLACPLTIPDGDVKASASACYDPKDYPAHQQGTIPVNRVFINKIGNPTAGGKANITIWYKAR
ncbi:MAG: hypothetical protein M1338_03750 [Patescibacteria group bacterium]|nr:hypothetical protein [Patescibacteria group bacterium]